MGERDVAQIGLGNADVSSSACLADKKSRQSAKIAAIREALIGDGFDTLAKQATVMTLSRSTAWAVLQAHHKSSGLSASVINRIFRSAEFPPTARRILEEYVREKLRGTYGHSASALMRFRSQLGEPVDPLVTRGRERR